MQAPAADPVLRTLLSDIMTHHMPIRSLILIGSRARGDADARADYDLIAIMDSPLVLIYAPKLERLSLLLSTRFGVRIRMRPMATLKLKRAKGSLFMMKVKKEASLLAGEDLASSVDTGSPYDISPEWYFSFLASLMKELISAYRPHDGSDECLSVDRVSMKIRRSLKELADMSAPSISFIIKGALHDFELVPDIDMWFKLRNLLITLFLKLAKVLLGIEGPIIDVAQKFLRINKGVSPLKNIESSAILFFLKKEIPTLRWVFSRILVKDRLRAALLLLLASVDKHGIDSLLLDEAYRILKPCFRIRPHVNDVRNRWYALRETILTYWDYVHTVMGFFD